MAQYPKIESIGSIGSILLAILEVQEFLNFQVFWKLGVTGPLVCSRPKREQPGLSNGQSAEWLGRSQELGAGCSEPHSANYDELRRGHT